MLVGAVGAAGSVGADKECISDGGSVKKKTKGYARGGAMKTKGYAKGGAMKTKGAAKGGKKFTPPRRKNTGLFG